MGIQSAAMMIKSVHVRKLFSEYDYDLELCCPLTFIHSPNGMGKSTLMHMLYAALKGDMRYLDETPFERMEIWFDDDAIMVLQNYDGRLSVLMQKNEVDVPLTDADMADVCNCIYIPPERLAYKKGDGARGDVTGMRYSEFYNGSNDTRVFLYGDGTNRTIYSGINGDTGLASADYFPDLYEAATVDGASSRRVFFRIVLPLIAPTAGIIAILCAINSLKVFDLVKTMTEGGPFYATDVIATYVYRMAYSSEVGMPRLGYSSAAALLFGLIVIVIGIALNFTKSILAKKKDI